MKRKIKILSLFDGISCGMVAAERVGLNVGAYYASEIEKKRYQGVKKELCGNNTNR